MGTRDLEMVRFRRRYYITYHQYDSCLPGGSRRQNRRQRPLRP